MSAPLDAAACYLRDPSVQTRQIISLDPEALEDFIASRDPFQAQWLRATGFRAAAGSLCLLPASDGTIAGAVIGRGAKADAPRYRFSFAKNLSQLPAGDWHLEGVEDAATIDEIMLAWGLHHYRFERYRKSAPAACKRLAPPKGHAIEKTIACVAAEYLTRDLINTPAQDMGPEALETALRELAHCHGAQVHSLCAEALISENFPMIHAVGRASPRAPRLLDLRWGSQGPRLTLVGKGVCFDTGGLDLKPASNMALMKKDMGGAATVMGLGQMIMAMKLPLQLRILIPAVDNVIAGNAFMPKDILTSRKGLSVEINNTDAEGRLILADALTYACEEPSDLLISMATLTGAARVAVGPDIAPYFSQDDRIAQLLEGGAKRGFDPVWRLPFHDPYEPVIEPGIADLDNAPAFGFAGAITAALFLRRFAAHPHYLHFDIYGHSPNDQPGRPKGGLGQGARAIFEALPEMLDL